MNPVYHLKRSGACKLNILLTTSCYVITWDRSRALEMRVLEKDSLRVKYLLFLLEKHSSRWEKFSLDDREDEAYIMRLLAAASFPKSFPSLRHVELIYHRKEPSAIGQLRIKAKDFISQWDMPALESLSLTNYAPSRIQASPKFVDFRFNNTIDDDDGDDDDDDGDNWNLLQFSSLLGSFTSMTKLAIKVESMFNDVSHDGPAAVLTRLEEFHLTVEVGSQQFLAGVINCLEMPNVSKVLINLDTDDVNSFGVDLELVNTLFPANKVRWPRAEELNFRLYCAPWTETLSMSTILSRLPRLNELTIRSCLTDFRAAQGKPAPQSIGFTAMKLAVHPLLAEESSCPPLRTLTLIECPHDTTFFMENIDVITSPTFEKLVIDDCWKVDKNLLRGLLPDDKVLFFNNKMVCALNGFTLSLSSLNPSSRSRLFSYDVPRFRALMVYATADWNFCPFTP